jgi:hypothetical protein
MEVYMNAQGQIQSCATRNYLLEKIRVSNPGRGERNFHVFYQLAKAASRDQRSKLRVESDPASYRYLETCCDVPTLNDPEDFVELNQVSCDSPLVFFRVVTRLLWVFGRRLTSSGFLGFGSVVACEAWELFAISGTVTLLETMMVFRGTWLKLGTIPPIASFSLRPFVFGISVPGCCPPTFGP